jgi:hypothetical protein
MRGYRQAKMELHTEQKNLDRSIKPLFVGAELPIDVGIDLGGLLVLDIDF